jgi:hypothetical protein
MLFPTTPDESAPEAELRAWIRYSRTLPFFHPSVTFAIEHAAKVVQEREVAALGSSPLTAAEARR